jgi:EKC/KEOPS complex subunit CGI121/TPRKB
VHHPQIGESFQKFGMTEQTQDLLVVKIAAELDAEAKMSQTLGRAVDADQRPFGGDGALAPSADADEVRKLYRLDGAASKGARAGKGASDVSGSPPQSRRSLESAILGLIALRGAT